MAFMRTGSRERQHRPTGVGLAEDHPTSVKQSSLKPLVEKVCRSVEALGQSRAATN